MTQDGEAAVRYARAVIEAEAGRRAPPAMPSIEGFSDRSGAFVTLDTYPGRELRGCIGIPMPVMPLGSAIASAAQSACHDPKIGRAHV